MSITSDQTEILVEIWEKVQEYIPQNKREDAATVYLETLLESDTLEFDKIELIESNIMLDKAYNVLVQDDDIETEEPEELEF